MSGGDHESTMQTSDQQNRKEAVDPRHSVLVRAPAGSGKTTLLAERYVKLLEMEDVEPENIACLTFTRKAAGEMRKKIQDEIDKAANGTVDKDRSRLSKYADPGHSSRIRVQTIDGFHRSLVRGDSLLAGVMPRFKSAVNRDLYYNVAGDAIARLSDATISDCQEGSNPVLTHWSNLSAQRKVVDMLRRRDGWIGRVADIGHEMHTDGDAGWIVLRWLNCIAKDLDKVFSVEREYDHIEISQAASTVLRRLGGASQLKRILGYPINHVLVDEVQDLSPSQFKFFEDLLSDCAPGCDERHDVDKVKTFFAVGDSMQSIYGFRGAGMEVIRRMFECGNGDEAVNGDRKLEAKIGGHTLRVKELRRNFRSTQRIVDGVESLLKSNMGEEARSAGRPRLLENVQGVDVGKSNGGGGVIVKVFDDEDDEAAWVARTMEEHLDKNSELAVLVRSRRQYIEKVVPKLSPKETIGVGFWRLDRQACINDIMTLGRCIEDPDDQVSGLALMRSPLVGMDSNEVHEAHKGGELGEAGIAPLCRWQSTMADGDACVPKWVAKFERFMVAYWRAQAEMRKMPVRCWIERAWVRAGGGEIYNRRADIQSLERFLDLVEEVCGNARFCDWDEIAARLRKMEASGASAVKVMTIHGAKGLEFETVIVPFLSGMGTREPRRDLVLTVPAKASGSGSDHEETSGGESFAYDDGNNVGDSVYETQRKTVRKRLMEEGRMLLYVAATRAKKKCWLTLTRPEAENDPNPKLVDWSMAARLEVDGQQVTNLFHLECLISKLTGSSVVTVEEGPCDEANKLDQPEPIGMDSDSELPSADGGTENTKSSTSVGTRPAKVRDLGLRGLSSSTSSESGTTGLRAGPTLSAIGEIVHVQIGKMLLNRLAWVEVLFNEEWNIRCREELHRRMRFSEISDSEFDHAIDRIKKHLTGVRRDPFMKRLGALASNPREGWRLVLEKSFIVKNMCGRSEKKRVDLLLRNEHQALIVDFKTGAESQVHEEQLEAYREVAKAAFADLRVASALYYTGDGEGAGGVSKGCRLKVGSDEGGLIARLLSDEAS